MKWNKYASLFQAFILHYNLTYNIKNYNYCWFSTKKILILQKTLLTVESKQKIKFQKIIYGSVFFNCVWKKCRIFSNFGNLFRKSFWAIIHLKKIFWADEGQVSRLWKWSVLCFWRKLIFFNWDFLWEENFFYISKYTYLL